MTLHSALYIDLWIVVVNSLVMGIGTVTMARNAGSRLLGGAVALVAVLFAVVLL